MFPRRIEFLVGLGGNPKRLRRSPARSSAIWAWLLCLLCACAPDDRIRPEGRLHRGDAKEAIQAVVDLSFNPSAVDLDDGLISAGVLAAYRRHGAAVARRAARLLVAWDNRVWAQVQEEIASRDPERVRSGLWAVEFLDVESAAADEVLLSLLPGASGGLGVQVVRALAWTGDELPDAVRIGLTREFDVRGERAGSLAPFALETMIRRDPRCPDAVAPLVRALRSAEPAALSAGLRVGGAAALYSPEVRSSLLELVVSPARPAWLRSAAADALRVCGTVHPVDIDSLLPTVASVGSPDLRRSVIALMCESPGAVASTSVGRAVLSALDDTSEWGVCTDAARLASSLGSEFLPRLLDGIESMGDDRRHARLLAVSGFRVKSPALQNVLRNLLATAKEVSTSRSVALHCLWRVGAPATELKEGIEEVLRSTNTPARYNLLSWLVEAGGEFRGLVPALCEVVYDLTDPVAAEAALALGVVGTGDHDAERALVAMRDSGDSELSAVAARALARFPHASMSATAKTLWRCLLEWRSQNSARNAIEGLGGMGPIDAGQIPRIREILLTSSNDEILVGCGRLLATSRVGWDGAVEQAICEVAFSPLADMELRLAALDVLRSSGTLHRHTLTMLTWAERSDPSPRFRAAAAHTRHGEK